MIINSSIGSSYTKLGETTFTVSTTSTSGTAVGTLDLGSSAVVADKILYVRVRDTAGKRAGYFYGSDTYFFNYQEANGGSESLSILTYAARAIHRYSTDSKWATYIGATTTGYGVYGYSITNAGVLTINRRYSSNYSLTINGTYKVEAYLLEPADGISPYV